MWYEAKNIYCLPTLKFLEQQKYIFNLSERFLVFRSSIHCYTAWVRSWVPCEYIQQIQLLKKIVISQKEMQIYCMKPRKDIFLLIVRVIFTKDISFFPHFADD